VGVGRAVAQVVCGGGRSIAPAPPGYCQPGMMDMTLYRWSQSASADASADTTINWAEGMRDGSGEVAGRGDFRLNLIHRDDIAGAIRAAFDAPATVDGGVFNVADDGAATKAEVVAFLAAKLGLPAPRFTGEPAGGRRRVTPDRVIANDKIKRVLGWRPRYPSFREGYAAILGA